MLYLTTWDFAHEETDGVCKKIKSQVVFFRNRGYKVDILFIKGNDIIFEQNGEKRFIGKVGTIKKVLAYLKMYPALKNQKYDYVYNRYGMMDSFYYRVLKRLHRNGAKILVEIPTYPYEKERTAGLLYWLMFKWDKIYQSRLKNVVNRIVTYSRDDRIFGIPTIGIKNGINLADVQPISGKSLDDTVDLLIVALMQPYHGYERLLYGLKKYYLSGNRKILCHFVGDGPEREAYEKIVSDNNLQEYVIFYGPKGGKELDEIYERADIGVCSLGGYKKGLFWSSELKSREYLAKGLPIIVGMELDVSDVIDKNYMLHFPNDASVIDIEKILTFYDTIYQKKKYITALKIRKMAEKCVGMEATMWPIFDYLKMEEEK